MELTEKMIKIIKTGFLIVILSFVPNLSSCSPNDIIKSGEISSEKIDINELQRFTRIQLPNNYWDLKVHEEAGIDRMMAFRFTMNERDLKQFIDSANYTGKLNSQKSELRFYTDSFKQYSWWKPDDAKKFLSGSYIDEHEWASKILIDLTNSPTVVVYVMVFTL